MKAVIWHEYGGPEVLTVKNIEIPVPKEDEVLIKVHAASISAGDCEIRSLRFSLMFRTMLRLFFGIRRPRETILGQEISGEVVELGSDVTTFDIGDKVFATTGLKFGGYGEYICIKAKRNEGVLLLMPSNMSYEEAACIPVGGLESRHFLSRSGLKKGEHVLINGAGGSIGSVGIQLAKYLGAEVTAVDSTEKFDLLKQAGADHVLDYTKDDIYAKGTYDVIFDIVGKGSFLKCLKSLKSRGRYMIANPRASLIIRGKLANLFSSKKVFTGTTIQKNDDLQYLKNLVEAGHIKAFIDKTIDIEDIVEAHRYVDAGLKKGNLIIKMKHDN